MKATEEGKPASVKVSFKVKKTGKASKYSYVSKVNVVDEKKESSFTIESVTATKANELTVVFADAVEDTTTVTLAVTKGSTTVEAGTPVWAADKASVVIPTVAKMTKGTYTVTAKQGEKETSGNADVVAQYVKEIKILNQTALTGKKTPTATEGGIAFVYYDVVDQYGESMRSSTTIEWSSSVKVGPNDKNLGKLELERADGRAFTYGEQIYITGVYAKTGVAVNATLTVGAAQALNSIEVKGFVKKGTSTVLQSLPANFKNNEYYLVYSVVDQNGNAMDTADYVKNNEVTFISDNVLVVKEITRSDSAPEATLTIDGMDYNAVFVTPGQNVNVGGEVNITAIANKTGNKTTLNVVVGDGQILKSFTMSQPEGVLADGEGAEIPFTALDQNGEKITNFVTLAKQSDFNNLKLSCGSGTLSLEEQDDGTAKLFWTDTDSTYTSWNDKSIDGIDRPVSLTAVVVGGESCNEMIYVSDKAYPVAIKDVDMKSAYLNAGEQAFSLGNFTFLDQYGRSMDKVEGTGYYDATNKKWVYDNGFFTSGNNGVVSGTEFANYTYGVKIEYKGEKSIVDALANTTSDFKDNGAEQVITAIGQKKTLRFDDDAVDTNKVSPDETLKFSIVRTEIGKTKYEDTSAVKSKTFKVVDIHKVTGFTIKDLKKFFVKSDLTGYATGVLGELNDTSIKGTVSGAAIAGITKSDGYAWDDTNNESKYAQQEVKVTATYAGESLDVPVKYYTVSGNKIGVATDGSGVVTTGAIGVNKVNQVTTGDADKFAFSDLYDATSAKFTRKDASDTLTVKIYPYNDATAGMVDSTSIKVAISDAKPAATTIKADDKYTFHPYNSALSTLDVNVVDRGNYACDNNSLLYNDAAFAFKKAYGAGGFKVEDQYGIDVTVAATKTYKVSKIVENADGYADNSFSVIGNGNTTTSVNGAELGDTFVLTVSADYNGTITKDIDVTVGSDYLSYINDVKNHYVEDLLDTLEDLRN